VPSPLGGGRPLGDAAIIIVYVWKTVGYAAVIFLAGCKAFQKTVRSRSLTALGAWPPGAVTLPGPGAYHFFLLVTTLLLAFQAFDIST
jgi:sn-glycerol 3-phosphate transport system permease protein